MLIVSVLIYNFKVFTVFWWECTSVCVCVGKWVHISCFSKFSFVCIFVFACLHICICWQFFLSVSLCSWVLQNGYNTKVTDNIIHLFTYVYIGASYLNLYYYTSAGWPDTIHSVHSQMLIYYILNNELTRIKYSFKNIR